MTRLEIRIDLRRLRFRVAASKMLASGEADMAGMWCSHGLAGFPERYPSIFRS